MNKSLVRCPRLRPAPWDVVLGLGIGLLAASMLWGFGHTDADSALTAVVYVNGAELERVELSGVRAPETRVYVSNGYTLHALYCPDGQPGVAVVRSDCPTQDCVHTGTVTRHGESIVCLPARVVIQIEGGASSGNAPDAVLR